MYETFEKLPDGKKKQIIQVCIEEFVEKGYQNASTNTMVKRLGISKGVLFLYFKNKKNLYLYLVEQVMESLTQDYFGEYGSGLVININVFDNLGEYYKELMQKKPDIFLFMLQVFVNAPAELKEEIDARHNQVHDNIFRYMSSEGFRPGVDIRLVDDLLHMVSYYVGQLIINDLKGKDLTIIKDEIRKNIVCYTELFARYVDILKYGVYAG